jgi:hypothetical protein
LVAVGVLTVAAVALALGQHWVTIAALLPLAYLLPCVAMMFMCMRGMNRPPQTNLVQASARPETPAATDIQN